MLFSSHCAHSGGLQSCRTAASSSTNRINCFLPHSPAPPALHSIQQQGRPCCEERVVQSVTQKFPALVWEVGEIWFWTRFVWSLPQPCCGNLGKGSKKFLFFFRRGEGRSSWTVSDLDILKNIEFCLTSFFPYMIWPCSDGWWIVASVTFS